MWISNYIHYTVWDENWYPFQNFNSATVEVWEWISNFIPRWSWKILHITNSTSIRLQSNVKGFHHLDIQIWASILTCLRMDVLPHGTPFHHDDVIKWKHFPHNWSFVQGIHQSPVNSPHNGQRCGTLMFSLICAWINGWVNNCEADDLRRHHAHYGVTVTFILIQLEHIIMRENGQ